MNAVDLFAGCGGLSLGLARSGIQVRAGFENWPDACRVYQANFDHPLHQLDLSNVDRLFNEIRPYRPDLIAGGPPCQDFSSAGSRNDVGRRADLTTDFCSIVSAIRPTWFLMENVERINKAAIFEQAKIEPSSCRVRAHRGGPECRTLRCAPAPQTHVPRWSVRRKGRLPS